MHVLKVSKLVSLLIMDTSMAQTVQTQASMSYNNATGSIPSSSSRVHCFLAGLARSKNGDSSDLERKITQLKIQRKKLRENAKKIKQRIKEQTQKLLSTEQQIDNIDLNILNLEALLEGDDAMDVK